VKPSLGRIVHYVDADGVDRAAIVSEFSELTPALVHLHVFQRFAVIPTFDVPYSEGKEPGSWHWPERE
jgi:hypothetical protein